MNTTIYFLSNIICSYDAIEYAYLHLHLSFPYEPIDKQKRLILWYCTRVSFKGGTDTGFFNCSERVALLKHKCKQ